MVQKDYRDFWLILSFVYIRYGKFKKALVLLEALHQLFPEDPDVLKHLAYVLLKLSEPERARQAVERFLELVGNDKRQQRVGLLLLSKALFNLHENELAREYMKRFLTT